MITKSILRWICLYVWLALQTLRRATGISRALQAGNQKKGLKKVQGRANHEVQTVNWNTGIFEAESA